MNTFFMFGKYASDGIHDIKAERTHQVGDLIAKFHGKVLGSYALLGEHDLVFIVELPNMTEAIKAALAMARLTHISFSTCAAMPVTEFDRVAEDIETEIESARMEAGE